MVHASLTSGQSTKGGRIIDFALTEIASGSQLMTMWQTLEARSKPSFFLSWGWIGTWLETLPATVNPALLHATIAGETVGLAIVLRQRHRRHVFVRTSALHLNETGNPALDCLTIEHNGMLSSQDVADHILQDAIRYLTGNVDSWDEIYIGGIDSGDLPDPGLLGLGCHLIDSKRSPFVDLSLISGQAGEYRRSLSANTRQQLNRAARYYEAQGPLVLEEAGSPAQARTFFGELRELHQAYWTGRGKPGSFANPLFAQFHDHLIATRFSSAEIQLLRLRVGAQTIGVLYNFNYRRGIYAYQSGFRYDDDNRAKPGLLMHCLAIEHNQRLGARCYDFLAGDGQHKRSLGNSTCEMRWIRLQKPRFSLHLETMLRQTRRQLAKFLQPGGI